VNKNAFLNHEHGLFTNCNNYTHFPPSEYLKQYFTRMTTLLFKVNQDAMSELMVFSHC